MTATQSRSVTVGFSIPEGEQARLSHLVEAFADGNRSAFLRLAMDRMEAVERAQRLRRLQSYGRERAEAAGIAPDEVSDRVKRVLARHAVS